ncbi:MAG: Stp1/IreP family PP2C-type Ser/Thr phosphatase [Caldiserica bacterium]|nr:Stp1/IreP family PP2C-type Ser/Thr phosphatase [Caldisericota bacterium]
MRIEASAVSDVGRVRTVNEDSYGMRDGQASGVSKYGSCFVVCDGMGGHQAGEVASGIAVDSFLEGFYREDVTETDTAQRVAVVLAGVNQLVYGRATGAPELQGMGTTIVGVVTKGTRAVVFNVGDSRCYRIRSNQVEQLSEDHSLVSELVQAHIITGEEARTSPRKNVLTRAIGNDPSVQAFIQTVEIRSGDCFLLCSDGLSNLLVDAEITATLATGDLHDGCSRLVALANERGGIDNITAMAVRCVSTGWRIGRRVR